MTSLEMRLIRQQQRAYNLEQQDILSAERVVKFAAKARYSILNMVAQRHNYRARKNGVEGSFTGRELWALREKQQFCCAYCQRRMNVYLLTVDHIVPTTRGGSNFISNICLACVKCNFSKNDHTPEEWVDRWYVHKLKSVDRRTYGGRQQDSTRIVNRLPDLLADKFGGKDNINLTHIAQDSGLSFPTVSGWVKKRVDRADFPILVKWCKYLDCQPGDILVYEEGEDDE